jgi:hypothetical protein
MDIAHTSFARVSIGSASSSRGCTLTEALVAIGAVTVLVATGTTVLANRERGVDSARKLAELAQANECYAADWANRQWTALPDDAGAFGDDCTSYIAANGSTSSTTSIYSVMPSAIFGRDASNAYWGFFIGGGFGCGNWPNMRPMNFAPASKQYGAWQLPNVWGFREYVSRSFYSPEWYAEDDPNYAVVSAQFNAAPEFTSNIGATTGPWSGLAVSSYSFSPAAMLNPGVLRAREDGGFQAPAAFVDSYRAPTVSQCMHPSLKTRMCETGWFRGAPSQGLPFNAGAASSPYTLFFDGSVQAISMSHAIADDAIVREGNKFDDGLWSNDTTLGPDGWQLVPSVDGATTSFHMLTTGGILGRDLLTRE